MARVAGETTPDRVLMERIAAGDERALAALYDCHGATAYALALTIAGERADAEEVVADAFGQMWWSAESFDPSRGSVLAWLTTITRSRALDLLRARGRRARATERAASMNDDGFAAPVAAAGAAPDRAPEQAEVRALVQRSLRDLPAPQRQVIELAYFGGLSHREIAAQLQEPLGTVKTRIRTALERLRVALGSLLEGAA